MYSSSLSNCCRYTLQGGLEDRPHEQDSPCDKDRFVCPHVLAAASVAGMCVCVCVCAASVAGKPHWEIQKRLGQCCGVYKSDSANAVVSRPGRLRTPLIPKALLVSLAVTPPRHHLSASS